MIGAQEVSAGIRLRDAGKIAGTNFVNEIAEAMNAFGGIGSIGEPGGNFRLFVIVLTGKESGVGKYACDVFDVPRSSLDPAEDALDRGDKLFANAIFSDGYKSDALWDEANPVRAFACIQGTWPSDDGDRTCLWGFALGFEECGGLDGSGDGGDDGTGGA